MIVIIKKADLKQGWITEPTEGETWEMLHCYTRGENLFVYITDGFESKILIDYQLTGIPDGVPGNAEQNIGEYHRERLNLPKRKQPGKQSIDDNE